MPWRGEKNPYKILVSEIMLQQTQVSRVIPKYKEFLTAFSTLDRLSRAPFSRVLRVWQGLGYNRRAKYLHSFAKEVTEKYKGKIPSDSNVLVTLPGIGKATAGSVCAFAFNKPVIFIETNIRRVYIHSFFPKAKRVSDKEVLSLVETTLDSKNPREWYHALMDYGAMLKSKTENPNRKSTHYTKQAKFSGSNREVRGRILKELIANNQQPIKTLEKILNFDIKRFEGALGELIKEGFVERKGKNEIQIKK